MKLQPRFAPVNRICVVLVCVCLSCLAGCHSHILSATIENRGPSALHLLEVDYPSASFGVQTLAPNSPVHHRFKIQGSGNVSVSYTDAGGKTRTATGPELREGDEGSITITIDAAGAVQFAPHLQTGSK